MRLSKLTAAVVAVPMALSAIAAAPVVVVEGEGETTESTVEVHTACDNPSGHTVINRDGTITLNPTTPLGVPFVELTQEDAGTYMLDLEGEPKGSTGTITGTLTWDNLEDLGDYDLIIDGENDLATDYPESKTTNTLAHCGTVTFETVVFIGTPMDTLTLVVKAK